ncbi:MAG: hypothetical protein JW860_03405, partial [Sedimentisphaerales bacterium]|nr:hypothetical protein [Sedimentisphaerales bacterium]
AIKGRGIVPALAQQSIREMERTGRSPEDVINTATWGVFQEGYQGGFLADADHLKTREHVRRTAGAGFTMFTCDPSDHVREGAAALQGNDLKDAFSQLDHWQELMARYVDKTFKAELSALGFGYEGRFGPEELMRAAVKYYRAIEFAGQMCEWLKEEAGGAFDYEISVDETGDPTSPLEHLFIIHELQRQNVEFVSLALRFVGDFQKGIDYIGDVEEFEDTLKAHAAIAKAFGPYKLSLHSGSDKFKIYPVFSKYTDNRYHVKTSGTSYLEAVKVIAEVNPELFRRIHAFALERFGRDRATYHVTTDLGLISDPHSLRDNELPSLLDQNAARQLFHITYGSVLSGQANGEYLFRDEFMKTLAQNEEKHYYFLNEHIGHHIDLLTGREK